MPESSLRIVSYNVRYFGHALKGLASTRASERAIASRLASLGIIGDDKGVRVEHDPLKPCIGAHVLAHLLAQETRLHVEEPGVEEGPEQFPT